MYQSIVLIYAMQLLSMSFIYVGPSVVKMLSGPVVSGKNNYWGTASTSALWCTAEEIVVSLGPIPVCLFRKKIPYRQSYACEFDSFTVYSNQKLPWSVQCGRKAIWWFLHACSYDSHGARMQSAQVILLVALCWQSHHIPSAIVLVFHRDIESVHILRGRLNAQPACFFCKPFGFRLYSTHACLNNIFNNVRRISTFHSRTADSPSKPKV